MNRTQASSGLRWPRVFVLFAVVALLCGVLAVNGAPVVNAETEALGGTGTASGLHQIGFSDLGGGGLNGEVAAVGNTAIVAGGVTASNTLRSHFYSPSPCPQVSVKVVDISDPTNPAVASTIPLPPGFTAMDVDALAVDTPAFDGDLAAIATATCSNANSSDEVGVRYYDVSNRASPLFLDKYLFRDPGGESEMRQSSVTLVQQDDGGVLSLSAATASFAGDSGKGDLRIVDVTDPANAVELSTFPLGPDRPLDTTGTVGTGTKNGCVLAQAGRDVGVTSDGNRAFLAFLDHGMFDLDISNPSSPEVNGRFGYDTEDRREEGGAAFVSVAKIGNSSFGLLAQEDWVAPDSHLRVDSPASVAGEKLACQAFYSLFDPEDTAQVYRHPDSEIAGQIVYVGRGCPSFESTPADPYLADPVGKIALIDAAANPTTQPDLDPLRFCPSTEAVRRVQQAGAIGAVRKIGTAFAFSTTGHPNALPLSPMPPPGLTIPLFQISTADGNALTSVLCPSVSGGNCTGGQQVTGAMVDEQGEWGGLHILDLNGPNPTEVSTYRPPTASVFPPPDLGVYSVHHAIESRDRAYVAANSDGLRVLDLTNPSAPQEIASFVPEDTVDPTGSIPAKAYVTGVEVAGNNVLITDINSGLYVLQLTCPGMQTDPRNQVVGTPGPDVLKGTSRVDVICGLGGNDTIAGLGAGDLLLGAGGKDGLSGGDGGDVISGGSGRDDLTGGPKNDELNGGPGRDKCNGGPGTNKLKSCER